MTNKLMNTAYIGKIKPFDRAVICNANIDYAAAGICKSNHFGSQGLGISNILFKLPRTIFTEGNLAAYIVFIQREIRFV